MPTGFATLAAQSNPILPLKTVRFQSILILFWLEFRRSPVQERVHRIARTVVNPIKTVVTFSQESSHPRPRKLFPRFPAGAESFVTTLRGIFRPQIFWVQCLPGPAREIPQELPFFHRRACDRSAGIPSNRAEAGSTGLRFGPDKHTGKDRDHAQPPVHGPGHPRAMSGRESRGRR